MSRVLQNKGNKITQHYGNNGHLGVDIVGEGSTIDYVVAHSDGTIVLCQKGQGHNPGSKGNASYGNFLKIKHNNGYYTLYAHLESTTLNNGQTVKKGQVLGKMGNTGNSYGNHLHFEVWNASGVRINPEPYLNADLPGINTNTTDCTGTITYQVFTNKWLSEVNKCDDTPNGYAGIGKEPIKAFRCKPQYGEIIYEARNLKGRWLGAVSSKDYNANNGNSYAGMLDRPIDGIRIKSTKGFVDYRVKTIEDGWLPWCRGWGETGNLYAGIKGHTIIGVQMK